jgi:hypothetical protein
MARDRGDFKSTATAGGGKGTTMSEQGTATTRTDIASGKTGNVASDVGGTIPNPAIR